MKPTNKVDHRPAFQFYPDDWVADTALSLCSLEAQGAWIRLLCHMFTSPERGVLLDAKSMRIDAEGVRKLLGIDHADAVRILCELDARGVSSTRSDGAIYNRRMMREACRELARSAAGRHAAMMRFHGSSSPTPTPSPSSMDVATAVEAPAAAPRFWIPKPIADIAMALHITSFCAKKLQDGYPARRLLAWMLAMGQSQSPVRNACAWLADVLKDGNEPRQDLMDRAKELLAVREAQVAAQGPATAQVAAAAREAAAAMTPARPESFAAKKNRTLRELDAAEKEGTR